MPKARKGSKRRKPVAREAPFEEGPAWSGMGGLEYVQAVRDGRIAVPPVWRLVGFRLAQVDAGYAVLEFEPAEHHYNHFGIAQGGLLCAVLDAALGCAVQSVLPASARFVSLELNAAYFHPVSAESGLMRCEGAIIHSGNRIVVAEARMMDGPGTLYARAASTCMILDKS